MGHLFSHPNRGRAQRKGPVAKRCRRFARWKRKYGSERAALQAANAMAERYGEVYAAFLCRSCGSWHVGRPYEEAA